MVVNNIMLNVSELQNNKLNIICEKSMEERVKIKEQILVQDPQYNVEIRNDFFTKSIGPFKIKPKSIYSIFENNKEIKKIGFDSLLSSFEALDIKQCIYRSPKAMSTNQLCRCSLIMDVFEKRKKYLFVDIDQKDKDSHGEIVTWLYATLRGSNETIIWITDMSMQEARKYCSGKEKVALYPKNQTETKKEEEPKEKNQVETKKEKKPKEKNQTELDVTVTLYDIGDKEMSEIRTFVLYRFLAKTKFIIEDGSVISLDFDSNDPLYLEFPGMKVTIHMEGVDVKSDMRKLLDYLSYELMVISTEDYYKALESFQKIKKESYYG